MRVPLLFFYCCYSNIATSLHYARVCSQNLIPGLLTEKCVKPPDRRWSLDTLTKQGKSEEGGGGEEMSLVRSFPCWNTCWKITSANRMSSAQVSGLRAERIIVFCQFPTMTQITLLSKQILLRARSVKVENKENKNWQRDFFEFQSVSPLTKEFPSNQNPAGDKSHFSPSQP